MIFQIQDDENSWLFPRLLVPSPFICILNENHISHSPSDIQDCLFPSPFLLLLLFLLILIFDSPDFQDCLLPSLDLIGTCECAFNINTTNVATLLVRSSSIQYFFPKDMGVDTLDISCYVPFMVKCCQGKA